MCGATGFLSHVGNFWPEHELLVWQLLGDKKYEEANAQLLKINYPFYDFIGKMSASTGIVDANVTKAAVELVGLPAGPVKPPARYLTAEEKRKLRSILEKAGIPFNRTR